MNTDEFIVLLVCIGVFLFGAVCVTAIVPDLFLSKKRGYIKAKTALVSLRRACNDIRARSQIYFCFSSPQSPGYQLLDIALSMSNDVVIQAEQIFQNVSQQDSSQIYKNVVEMCDSSERALRNAFSAIEAFFFAECSGRQIVLRDGTVIELPE